MNDEWELGRKISFYNGSLRKLRIERGLLQKDVAKGTGVNVHLISQYETMRCVPTKQNAEKIAKFFGVEVSKIFPEFLPMLKEKIPKSEVKYAKLTQEAIENYKEAQLLLEEENAGPENQAKREEVKEKLYSALWSLSDRQRKIICMRYGLMGEDAHTLEEVAWEFSVTRERIRQLEAKALSQLRRNRELLEVKELGDALKYF